MPALAKALTGYLPDAAVRQLMQALGNCNQPMTSRAVQNFQPPEQIGNRGGVYTGGLLKQDRLLGLYLKNELRGGRQTERISEAIGRRFFDMVQGRKVPMAKAKTIYACTECGARSPRAGARTSSSTG